MHSSERWVKSSFGQYFFFEGFNMDANRKAIKFYFEESFLFIFYNKTSGLLNLNEVTQPRNCHKSPQCYV